jgi:predicted nucleic acid-binding protein
MNVDNGESIGSTPAQPFVIDTSVALKWYVPEAGRLEALQYMAPGIERHAPDLLPLEGAHALLKRTRSTDPSVRLSVNDVLMVVETLRDSAPIVYHACGPLLASALALAIEIGASTYDGLFLSLAILLDGQVVTADRKFHDKIQASPHHLRVRWFMDPP